MAINLKQLPGGSRKWFLPVAWVLASLLVSFILARFIFPEIEIEKRFFGLTEVRHYSFNPGTFLKTLAVSSGILVLGAGLYRIQAFRKLTGWLTARVFRSAWFILLVSIVSAVFYVLGLTQKLFISEQFFLVSKEVTLLSSIRMLFDYDENFLGTIIFTFTIVFPISKYILLYSSFLFRQQAWVSTVNRWMSVISKWSMLDVYIVALLLLNMKFDSRIVNMELKQGVIWFSLSIILIMVAMLIQGSRGEPE